MNTEDRKGYFLLSLDTEFGWGYFDCLPPELFSSDGQRERDTINLILDTLDEFGVIATWAVVGHFFLKHHKEAGSFPITDWKERDPVFEELYESDSPVLYGADVIENMLTRGTKHEIAFHGYTHRVFLEGTMSRKEARAEIQAWSKIAARKKIIAKTAVFPRNKIGYLDLFKEHEFICYRGEELMPRVGTLPVVGRVFRRFYDFLSLFLTPVTYEPQVDRSGLVNLPSSRWLFGFNRHVEQMLDALNLHKLQIAQIVKGVEKAARNKQVLHVWAHPHEFQTLKDMEKLRYLLGHVREEIDKARLQSLGMAQLAKEVIAHQYCKQWS